MRRVPGQYRRMQTACRGAHASHVRCKWTPPGCTRFRVRNRFPRADRLLELQAASHAACWKYKSLLPSCLSAQRTSPAGANGKVVWRCARTGRMGTYLRDDQCETRKLDEEIQRVRPGGAAPEPLPRDASMSFSRSESREFVAVRSVTGACDDSSQTPNPGPRRQLFVAGVVKPSPRRQFLVG